MATGQSWARNSACRVVLLGTIAVLAVGCGLQSGQHHQAHGARHRHRHGTSTSVACAPSNIKVRLDTSSAGVAAGTSYVPLDFTNVSSAGCRLAGFPSVSLASGPHGTPIGSAAAPFPGATGSSGATSLVLPSTAAAHAWVHIADVANIPSAQCDPVRAAGFLVTLPGQATTAFVRYPVTTCADGVSGMQILTVEPFYPGLAKPGTAQ